jgi:hypothetical protein
MSQDRINTLRLICLLVSTFHSPFLLSHLYFSTVSTNAWSETYATVDMAQAMQLIKNTGGVTLGSPLSANCIILKGGVLQGRDLTQSCCYKYFLVIIVLSRIDVRDEFQLRKLHT